MKFVIYRHTNIKTGKSYVGISHHPFIRWKEHVKNAFNRIDFKFYRAIRKHGTTCWKHDVLEIVQDKKTAYLIEKYWIHKLDSYKNGYNMTLGGDGVVGLTKTVEQREKLSTLAKLRSVVEKERFAKINIGRKHSIETRQKWSQLRQGKHHSDATILKLKNKIPWNKGRKLSEKTRLKMSESRKGHKNPFFGRKHSIETIERIKISQRQRGEKQ